MQAVALSLKADHYYFNNNLDSLKAWIPRVQDFARKNDQIKYYYFTWSRLILYYTKQAQYTLAQYELEQYMSQAEKDNYKPATAEAYKQLGHIYRTRGLKNPLWNTTGRQSISSSRTGSTHSISRTSIRNSRPC